MTIDKLVARLQQRDRLALARLLTFVACGEQVDAIRHALSSDDSDHQTDRARDQRHSVLGTKYSVPGEPQGETIPKASSGREGWGSTTPGSACSAPVIAFTGGGGVGKSTLIGKLIEFLRIRGKTVAVLACDPESSLTGGALLGDRIRMSSRPEDEGVLIRSLATPHGHEAIAPNIDLMTQLLRNFGFDIVLVETAGAGQGDTAIRHVADLVVLLVQPETGDELQWEKAGLLEVADVVVVHKADMPGAERLEMQLRDLINLTSYRAVPVVRVSSIKGQGLAELWMAIEQSPSQSNTGSK